MKITDNKEVRELIRLGLAEDIGDGDLTTNALIPDTQNRTATMVAKASGVIAGLEVAEYVFRQLCKDIEWHPLVKEGDAVVKGDTIVRIQGSYRALLTGERLALNLIQRMSGIATETARYVAVCTGATRILDTRKTAPGMRLLDKYAVKTGGGQNHRMGLYDMVMIKDNHIKAAGTIARAVAQVRNHVSEEILVEVETTTLAEVEEAITAHADVILLDNMSTPMMAEAVKIIAGRAKSEASGNMTLERVAEVAATGVDYISVGALTHSVKALDISMNFIQEEA